MIRRFSISLFTIILSTFIFTSCSSDDDNNDSSNPNIPEVSDPSSLQAGQAEFAAAGTEGFDVTTASATWRKGGAMTVNGRTFAETKVTIESEDIQVSITFYVHDPDADMFGGKLPQAGSYDFDLSTDETSSEDTESYADVFVSGSSLEYAYSDNDSQGSVIITSFDSGVLEGTVNLTGMTNSDFSDEVVLFDLAASYSATEQ